MQTMDYSKLLGRIKELGYTQKSTSNAIGISESQLCLKLSGNYPFKQTDIQKLCECLKIPIQEIGDYFFKIKVEETELRNNVQRLDELLD